MNDIFLKEKHKLMPLPLNPISIEALFRNGFLISLEKSILHHQVNINGFLQLQIISQNE